MAKKTLGYEKAMDELSKRVEALENGELPLDQAMKTYEEGVALSKELQAILKERQGRIETLSEQMKDSEPDESDA